MIDARWFDMHGHSFEIEGSDDGTILSLRGGTRRVEQDRTLFSDEELADMRETIRAAVRLRDEAKQRKADLAADMVRP